MRCLDRLNGVFGKVYLKEVFARVCPFNWSFISGCGIDLFVRAQKVLFVALMLNESRCSQLGDHPCRNREGGSWTLP